MPPTLPFLADLPAVILLLFVVLFAWADRFSGGGAGWSRLSRDGGGPLPGHGTLYAGAAVVAVVLLLHGLFAALVALIWALARSEPWDEFGRSAITPEGVSGKLWAFVRHSYVLLGLGPILLFWFADGRLPPTIIPLLAYPVLATALAVRQTDAVLGGRDITAQTELTRGAAFGLLLFAVQ
jgi:hypothetical protein